MGQDNRDGRGDSGAAEEHWKRQPPPPLARERQERFEADPAEQCQADRCQKQHAARNPQPRQQRVVESKQSARVAKRERTRAGDDETKKDRDAPAVAVEERKRRKRREDPADIGQVIGKRPMRRTIDDAIERKQQRGEIPDVPASLECLSVGQPGAAAGLGHKRRRRQQQERSSARRQRSE